MTGFIEPAPKEDKELDDLVSIWWQNNLGMLLSVDNYARNQLKAAINQLRTRYRIAELEKLKIVGDLRKPKHEQEFRMMAVSWEKINDRIDELNASLEQNKGEDNE